MCIAQPCALNARGANNASNPAHLNAGIGDFPDSGQASYRTGAAGNPVPCGRSHPLCTREL